MHSVLRVHGAGQEQQSKLADLHLVAVRQISRVNRFTVDVSAVEAADVDNLEFAAHAPELGVPAAYGDVVEEDIAVRVTTGRAALHHQIRRALRQALRHRGRHRNPRRSSTEQAQQASNRRSRNVKAATLPDR